VVTDDALAAEQEHRATPPVVGAAPASVQPPTPGSEAAIETVLAALREAHAGEVGRLTEALAVERAGADALTTRGEALATEVRLVQVKLAEAEQAHTQARVAAQLAQDQLNAYRRADTERKARGLLERLRDALRGQ
jgi:hypothetical protein